MTRILVIVIAVIAVITTISTLPDSSVTRLATLAFFRSEKPAPTAAEISRHIVGRAVPVTGLKEGGLPTPWTFEPDDFRDVEILNAQVDETGFMVNVVVTTNSNPRQGDTEVHVAGTLRLHYEWADDRWNLREIENVSFRYSFHHG